MICYHALLSLLTTFVLLDSPVFATPSSRPKIPTPGALFHDNTSGRLLRVDLATNIEAGDEERGLLSNVLMKASAKKWASAGKSDDYAKNALGMKQLTGAALEAHPNYKYYDTFVKHTLKKWLKEDKSTYSVWIKLGLLDVDNDQLWSTDAFKVYMRYAKMFDDKMWRTLGTSSQPSIYYEGSRAERLAKAKVWADAERPNWYVKKMMGLDLVHENALRSQADYPYYQEFLRLTRQARA